MGSVLSTQHNSKKNEKNLMSIFIIKKGENNVLSNSERK